MNRPAANPEREAINARLDEVRAAQSDLFRRQRRGGLTAKENERLADLGREEIALENSKRDTGRRVIGARHHKR